MFIGKPFPLRLSLDTPRPVVLSLGRVTVFATLLPLAEPYLSCVIRLTIVHIAQKNMSRLPHDVFVPTDVHTTRARVKENWA